MTFHQGSTTGVHYTHYRRKNGALEYAFVRLERGGGYQVRFLDGAMNLVSTAQRRSFGAAKALVRRRAAR